MIRTTRALLLALLAGSAGADDLARGQQLADAFQQQLKGRLMTAMQQGGPVQAIAVCQEEAPALAQAFAAREGVRIGRVGTRLRNPANTGQRWQQAVLADFSQQVEHGTAPAGLRTLVQRGLPEGVRAGYAQAIVAQGPCLICHGEQVAPAVREALASRYPADQATDYREGDLRGLLWVEFPTTP